MDSRRQKVELFVCLVVFNGAGDVLVQVTGDGLVLPVFDALKEESAPQSHLKGVMTAVGQDWITEHVVSGEVNFPDPECGILKWFDDTELVAHGLLVVWENVDIALHADGYFTWCACSDLSLLPSAHAALVTEVQAGSNRPLYGSFSPRGQSEKVHTSFTQMQSGHLNNWLNSVWGRQGQPVAS